MVVGMDHVALRPREVADMARCSLSWIRACIRDHRLAHVRLGNRVVVLVGDAAVFQGASPAEDGRKTLAAAWPGRRTLWLSEVAEALGVSKRHLLRLAGAGELPGHLRNGRWVIPRDELVKHLLRLREPSRWEVAVVG